MIELTRRRMMMSNSGTEPVGSEGSVDSTHRSNIGRTDTQSNNVQVAAMGRADDVHAGNNIHNQLTQ